MRLAKTCWEWVVKAWHMHREGTGYLSSRKDVTGGFVKTGGRLCKGIFSISYIKIRH